MLFWEGLELSFLKMAQHQTGGIGYNVGTCIIDLGILDTEGSIGLKDFVLDWSKSIAFNDAEYKVGYILKKGVATPKEF